MKKIKLNLAPPEESGGRHDPNLQLLKEIFPGRATITVKEACDVLGVSDDFIYERLNSGEIKGIKTGRNWAIPLTEVARLLKEGVA
jgi:excisionase family DNA binding protein